MELWSWWIIFALIFAIIEFFLPGLTLACLSAGALMSATIAWFSGTFPQQLATFSIASLIFFFFIARPLSFALAKKQNDKGEKSNVDALIGQRGKVTTFIPGKDERGWVKLTNEEWAGMSLNREAINEGTEVIVEKINGNTLIVKGV